MDTNTVVIWTIALLIDLLINVKVIALEKLSFGDIQNRKSVS